jgi:hypothetical protein
MINFHYETFPNFGFIKAVLSEEQIKPIKDEINFIKNNFDNASKANLILAGNIEKEYHLKSSHSHIEFLLLPLAQAYLNVNDYKNYSLKEQKRYNDSEDKTTDIKLLNAWVNFQNKYEFNPLHNHSGLLSFVIWVDLPFLLDDELKQPHVKNANTKIASKFCFMYTDILGNLTDYPFNADKNYNNGLLLFPAKLNHIVYPFFTSNEQRISVSGNFGIKTKKNESA